MGMPTLATEMALSPTVVDRDRPARLLASTLRAGGIQCTLHDAAR